MKSIKLFALLIITIFCITGCGSNQIECPPEKTISMTLPQEPSTLDPAMSYGLAENNVELLLFEGLTRMDENNQAQPALAESWEISPDGLTYTFHLRQGIKWSDGNSITAKDFVYSWLRVLDPKFGSGNAYMLFIIAGAEEYNSEEISAEQVGIKALDSNTLQVKLKEPATYFIDLTAFHALYPVPEHITREKNDTWGNNYETIVGCGPFKIIKWAHSSEIILEKNENYWNRDIVASDYIKLPISDSNSTRLTMVESGLTDMITDPPPADENRLKEMGLYKIEPQLGTTYYVFNVTKPPFDRTEVRKAFAMAITRKEMIEKVVRNGKIPANTFVPPGMSFNGRDFALEGGSLITEDAQQAKKLLEASGYNGEPVTILYNTSDMNKAISESLQGMWKDALGVEVELTNQETKVFFDSRENGDYQIAFANWIADFADPVNFLDVFAEKNNDAQYHKPEYNAIMAAAHKEVNQTRRLELLHKAERMLFEDCVVIPLFYTSQVIVVNPELKGYICTPMGNIDLIRAYKEKSN
ncbi:MAG: peptide ABC transporter substrate-binding protein [Anaerovibrio sp.]|uniref:peptide ABC transporter substrate-binding protein n=1 Tax=Anaerovibrio sp. TaxID=1872532 RepID=UPI0025D2A9AD|nr:peptide ABC transporter substrate-binding protein [Anaerovibrio sp.]MCR5176316.1 peptide ABC transporter substrate-binding protein [Anaerovibrio sp.]